jgi:ferredoxin-type protein NapF
VISRREFLRGKFSAPPEPARVSAPTRSLALIGRNCVTYDNVACTSCADACGETAIRFSPRFGAAAEPEIIAERCTGCGDCLPVCPGKTISLITLQSG